MLNTPSFSSTSEVLLAIACKARISSKRTNIESEKARMTLKDLLKRHKADDHAEIRAGSPSRSGRYYSGEGESRNAPAQAQPGLDVPEFTFMRTTTSTQEIIEPPTHPGDHTGQVKVAAVDNSVPASSPKRLSRFRRHSNAGQDAPVAQLDGAPRTSREDKRLSERLHFGNRGRSNSIASANLPTDLADVSTMSVGQDEDTWEKRATILAQSNPNAKTYQDGTAPPTGPLSRPTSQHRRTPSQEEIRAGDDDIQEAIRLHESGDLKRSTEMFGRLGDPKGANNALSQVLYGLALRHGWGITKDETRAVTYLSAAASNSANIEELALQAGMKKGGLAKGELTLAIFELANCFRNGWGVKKDPMAAKQYYETAANMGDTDAMNEVAWCYLEGFGCKKDKVSSSLVPYEAYITIGIACLSSS